MAVVGGGAAGLAAAAALGRRGVRATVFERMERPGTKLAATGGGRGNVAHLCTEEEFAGAFGRRGRFGVPAYRALGGAEGLRALLSEAGVETVADGTGRVYPRSMKAEEVRAALEREARRLGAAFCCGCRVEALEPLAEGGWRVDGRRFGGVVLAAGGRSASALGSDGSGFGLLAGLGHRLVEPVPGLAGLLLDEPWLAANSGASVADAVLRVRAGRRTCEVRGELLATHAGVSGPAALAISGAVAREWRRSGGAVALELGLVPEGIDWAERRRVDGGTAVRRILAERMPKGLAEGFLMRCGVPADLPVARLTGGQLRMLGAAATGLAVRVRGIAPFEQSMVTCGGCDLREVDPETLESRRSRGLFLAGEILDMDAPSGGWNLLWAFSSGWLAGGAAARRAREGA